MIHVRCVVRCHRRATAVLHPIAGVRQQHGGARRDHRQREERDDRTTKGVHDGSDHGRMNDSTARSRQVSHQRR